MRVAWALCAFALAAASLPRAEEPGWLWERACLTGPEGSQAGPEGGLAGPEGSLAGPEGSPAGPEGSPAEGMHGGPDGGPARRAKAPAAIPGGDTLGFLAGGLALDTAAIRKPAGAWLAPDTLRPPGGIGSPRRLRVYRSGQPLLADQDFRLPAGDSLIVFAAPVAPGDSVCWERAYTPLLPRPLPPLYRLESVPVYRPEVRDTAPATAMPTGPAGGDTAYGKYRLNYSGSKSMAVTVGSGGGLGLDASLFLNLDGQVAEDVFIEGQLSDQNVPIQPEGNTATLKEVDTKFMRVYGKRYAYTLGDYLLDYGVAGEDRFTAKVQGVDGRYARDGYLAHGSWSVSEGQYQSDTLRGVDGKQRGYYLRGRDGRTFITVLAGTERVWRNGVLLKRGVDYTIDYSEGRLDFPPPLVVTGENLFAAEYQYTEQDFPRTLAAGEVRDSVGAFTWSLRAIDESEDQDNPFGLKPDSALARRFLSLGDSVYSDSLGRPVAMPHRQSSSAFDLGLKLPGYEGHAALLFSRLDRNRYSPRDDNDDLGYSTRYLGIHAFGRPINRGGLGRAELTLDHESRSRNYEPFKQLLEPRAFLETWNLDARVARKGFFADRLWALEKPFTALALGAEVGLARADSSADTVGTAAGRGSQSRRAGLSARLGGDRLYAEAATEVKLARSPARRDNYKQSAGAGLDAGGLMPSFRWARNEWIAELPSGVIALSEKQEPAFTLATAPIAGRLTLASELSLLSQRSDFDGRLPDPRDSVRAWGFTEKVLLLGWGPWASDLFYSYRDHRAWRVDASGRWSGQPEESRFNQVEWNSHLADGRKGYSLISSYRVGQTAEFPLVEEYRELKGRGDYVYDSTAKAYHKVETAGDFVLIGLMRDTTVGSRPYQDLSFHSNLDLTPSRFPFPVTGVLADIEFSLNLACDAQDTSASPALLPLFTDAQLERARSGHASYAPALHWKAPGGGRAANLELERSYGKAAGIYAYREKLWSQRADFRSEAGPAWEWYLEQAYENRDRGAGSDFASRASTRNQLYGARLTRKLPKSFQAEARSQYLRIDGSGPGGPTGLNGAKPALKLEKTALFNGRAFAEYGLIYFWGRGDGGYYATGDFSKGLTHRFEANADFQVGVNLYLNFDYVARVEPGGEELVQKMTAEARAVF